MGKQLIDGMTKGELREKVYAIAERNEYRTRSDSWIENSGGFGWPEMAASDQAWILNSLVPCHPYYTIKSGCGLESFVFGYNTYHKSRTNGRPSARLYGRRVDGTITDISWVQCIGVPPNRERVSKAMRSLVAYQTREFRDNSDHVCRMCGQKISPSDIDVDHTGKMFAAIATDWVNEVGLDEWELKVSGDVDLFVGGMFKDDELNRSWQEYHAKHATLRILCRPCHRKAPKK